MRAAVIHAPHDLRVENQANPVVGPAQVLVRVRAGGICGSDLHYYHHGGFGIVRIKEPMILGHEVSGIVEAVGDGVVRVKPGDRIAVNPSRPCGQCRFCLEGNHQHCLDMRFFGSAMRYPHAQGLFRDLVVIEEAQAYPVGAETPLEEAAFAEPLSVCLHAVQQAGPLLGKRVLITGTGPIGCLMIVAARLAGAQEILATDIEPFPLSVATQVGAHRAFNVAEDKEALARYAENKGTVDVVFECSGSESAQRSAIEVVRPQGRIVLVGLGGESRLPLSLTTTKEVMLQGTFRFDAEFGWAVDLLSNRAVDVRPLLSASKPVERAVEAFELASNRKQALKVQIRFD